MYHPLISDPKKLKDSELEDKVLDLSKKYLIASRMGQGAVLSQILCALDMYKEELQKRRTESTNKVMKTQDKDFSDLINVN